METLLKKRWFKPAAVGVAVLIVAVLAYVFFFAENYASIKDKDVVNPPFEGVYWGMTKAEFCKAMGIEENRLTPAAPFKTDDWCWNLKNIEKTYSVSADELPLYDGYENQYYLAMTKPIFGEDNYFVDDQPMSIRVVFTNETTYNGKTIPPLLCAVLFKVPKESEWSVGNEASLYYTNEAMEANEFFGGREKSVNPKTIHKQAQLLSYMYACGMSAEEIAAEDVLHMSEEEQLTMLQKIIGVRTFVMLRGTSPSISIQEKIDVNGTHPGWDTESIYVTIDAGYMAYYEYFLHELT